jgi:gliding motility-associated-like protein
LEVVVTSSFNCGLPAQRSADFIIKPLPKVEAQFKDGCLEENLSFIGVQTDNATIISQWQWSFGDGTGAATKNAMHQYRLPKQYAVRLWAEATNGCSSDTILSTININAAAVFAGNDTAVIKDFPFQLNGSGNGAFLWSPAMNLSNPAIANPVATLSDDQQYVLTVTTAEGCTAEDTILIRTFNGPAIYVPTAFTPNGDGKNDMLRPVYVGIKELKQFAVFNRWGQMVFTTNNLQKGWEGRNAPGETYVWIIRAVNSLGQVMRVKGMVTIIR